MAYNGLRRCFMMMPHRQRPCSN